MLLDEEQGKNLGPRLNLDNYTDKRYVIPVDLIVPAMNGCLVIPMVFRFSVMLLVCDYNHILFCSDYIYFCTMILCSKQLTVSTQIQVFLIAVNGG